MGFYRYRRFFLSLLVVFVLFSACSKCYATTTVFDPTEELINIQKTTQDDFILLCLYPYMNNTEAWQNTLKPLFDTIHENGYNIYMFRRSPTGNFNTIGFNMWYYQYHQSTGQTTVNFVSQTYPNTSLPVIAYTYNLTANTIQYNPSDNSFSLQSASSSQSVPQCISQYFSPMWIDFMQLIYSDYVDYGAILNDIKTYLANIDLNTSVDHYGYILSQIYSVCAQISQNIGNYSQDLQDIQDKLDDINDELTDINTYLNNTTLDPNTITNNFPNNSGITSPTDSILSNIFTQYQNAFTSTNYTDIVIPLGYVNEFITIPSDYTETFFPTPLVTIIQLCYWYVISRWIIISLIKLVNSLRNLDFMEKTNDADPKTELL